MTETGKIQVFTGEGKGKTTAALGLAWRAIGRGLKVFMVQFMKAPDTSGEHFAAKAFAPMMTIKPMGRKGFIVGRGCDPLDAVMAELALEEARNAMLGGEYDVIILDEINVAVNFGIVDVKNVLELLEAKPKKVEMVLTGRYAHRK
jgi:cob(I)alamin adenosyltransferase